jgi:hypothetical protein
VNSPSEAELSLGAELLLLSVDPARGGLLGKRRRMRKALRATGSGRRRALGELRAARLITRDRPLGRIRLADRAEAGARFRHLREALADGTLDADGADEGRERDLAMLLAWTGALGARLSAHERRVASRRIRALAQSARRAHEVPSASHVLPPLILALGLAATDDLFETPLGGDFSAGDGSFTAGELGGFDVGGGDSGN